MMLILSATMREEIATARRVIGINWSDKLATLILPWHLLSCPIPDFPSVSIVQFVHDIDKLFSCMLGVEKFGGRTPEFLAQVCLDCARVYTYSDGRVSLLLHLQLQIEGLDDLVESCL